MKNSTLLDRASHCNGTFSLVASDILRAGGVLSPYFQPTDMRKMGTAARDIRLSLTMTKAFILGYEPTGLNFSVVFFIADSSNTFTGNYEVPVAAPSTTDTDATIEANIVADIAAFCTTNGITVPSAYDWTVTSPSDVAAAITAAIPAAPSSYQTIVSQTGTAAPAVSGSLVPTSTYPAGTTFTWARTGAGVYTLTASTAVFNTSGKTGVFIAPLQNLNASIKAVVTSSTVITVTTAVQSVAILGLLGLTATATDALLSQTMIYVQTYA